MPIGTNGPQGSGMKRSTMGVKRSKVKVTRGQRSRSHEVKDRLGGSAARRQASFSTLLGRVEFLLLWLSCSE